MNAVDVGLSLASLATSGQVATVQAAYNVVASKAPRTSRFHKRRLDEVDFTAVAAVAGISGVAGVSGGAGVWGMEREV